jgi:hypothetical protein
MGYVCLINFFEKELDVRSFLLTLCVVLISGCGGDTKPVNQDVSSSSSRYSRADLDRVNQAVRELVFEDNRVLGLPDDPGGQILWVREKVGNVRSVRREVEALFREVPLSQCEGVRPSDRLFREVALEVLEFWEDSINLEATCLFREPIGEAAKLPGGSQAKSGKYLSKVVGWDHITGAATDYARAKELADEAATFQAEGNAEYRKEVNQLLYATSLTSVKSNRDFLEIVRDVTLALDGVEEHSFVLKKSPEFEKLLKQFE